MNILSIETSCDETSVAVLKCSGGFKNPRFKVLSNIVLSQIEIHKSFGGVVPNLARREHQKNLVLILTQALKKSGLLKSKIKNQKSKILIKNKKLLNKILIRESELFEKILEFLEKYEKPKIDLIAVTRGPGLEPALWVGVNFARALSKVWQITVLGVNHLEGHIFSVFLKENRENIKYKVLNSKQITNNKFQILNKIKNQKIKFPSLALIVSGGHTELVLMEDWIKYKIIGSTLDDAAGEAFDKSARILGLVYPGGPEISREAEKWKLQILNSKSKINLKSKFLNSKQIQNLEQEIKLPRPMINIKNFNFSFSGLKTAILYLVNDLKKSGKWSKELIPQVAYEFQEAVIDVLILKSLKATEKYNVKTFVLCGGVSANKELRLRFKEKIQEKFGKKINFLMPELKFSGDNAAIIGSAAYSNYLNLKLKRKLSKISFFFKANGNLNF